MSALLALLRANAKAIAALVAPILVTLVAWVVEAVGIETPYDPSKLDQAITGAIVAVIVWATSNGGD